MKKLLLGLAGTLLISGAFAATSSSSGSTDSSPASTDSSGPDIKDSAPGRYTVVKGDTLWDISGRYLKSPWRWPEIWQANQQISNPHWIYPGDVLVLCQIKDKKIVAMDQGNGCADIPGATPVGTASGSSPAITGSGRDFKLHPQVRSESLSIAIPAIPLSAIRAFLNNSRVVDADTLQKAPYVVAGADDHVVAGAGDKVYARGKGLQMNNYGIYRGGVRYTDLDTGEVLGYEATAVGSGKVIAIDAGVGTVSVLGTEGEEVLIEDKLLPNEQRNVQPIFSPRNPDHVKKGRLLRVFGSIGSAAVNSVVVLSRGERDGVKQGDTFAVYKHGAVIHDRVADEAVRLPSEREGLAMVFRTFDKVSYALVLKASNPISVGDDIVPPINGD
jgi:hypothetical protein